MFTRRETQHTLGERGILGDEAVADLLSKFDQLQHEVTQLRDRVDSQFTTIAAHAEIAREQAEFARAEARSDLDRTRDTLIELIEQARADRSDTHRPGSAPGPSTIDMGDRITGLEARLVEVADTMERCFTRQNELADTMSAFLDTVIAEQRGEPVAGLSLL